MESGNAGMFGREKTEKAEKKRRRSKIRNPQKHTKGDQVSINCI